jgi:hypothetical protein
MVRSRVAIGQIAFPARRIWHRRLIAELGTHHPQLLFELSANVDENGL